jgi:hypothetical protein
MMWAGQLGNLGSIPDRARSYFLEAKRPNQEVDHLHLFSPEVKGEWNYTSSLSRTSFAGTMAALFSPLSYMH